ncbi:MAG: CBS domain-containing protein [bacterium]|nr:CBS domain-containing protein [bacterium]
MNRRVEGVAPDAPIAAATHTLMRRGYSGAPVVDEGGQLLGVLSEEDCIRVLAESIYEGWPAGTAADHMTQEVEVAAPDEDVFAVAGRFSEGGHRRIFVVDEGRLAGMISRRDLLRALDSMRAEVERGERSDTYSLIQIRHQKYD